MSSLRSLLFEVDDGLATGERLDGAYEPLGQLANQDGRREPVATMLGQEPGKLTGALQSRHVAMQVQPVDALDLERHVIPEYRIDVRHGATSPWRTPRRLGW